MTPHLAAARRLRCLAPEMNAIENCRFSLTCGILRRKKKKKKLSSQIQITDWWLMDGWGLEAAVSERGKEGQNVQTSTHHISQSPGCKIQHGNYS